MALDALAQLAGRLADLDASRREAVATELRAQGGPAVATLTRVVLQCYYRDDRVIRSLGLEPRPPYPRGHVLEDGDWSLLDPVRAPRHPGGVYSGRNEIARGLHLGRRPRVRRADRHLNLVK